MGERWRLVVLALRVGRKVNGGREVSPDDKAALDIWYIVNASLWLDIAILLVRGYYYGPRRARVIAAHYKAAHVTLEK